MPWPGRAGPVFRHDRTTLMIPDLKDLPYEQRLAKNKLWSLEDRRTRADLIEVYKIIHGLSAVRFSTFFKFSHNERTVPVPVNMAACLFFTLKNSICCSHTD